LQQRPKLGDIFHPFEIQRFRNQLCGRRRPQNGRDQVAAFRNHFVTSHRICGRPAHGGGVLAKLRSVDECHFHDRLALLFGVTFDLRVQYELDLGSLFKHCGIMHARFVVSGGERSRLVDQHHRQHVLHAYVRHLAIVHHRTHHRPEPHDHLLHLIRFYRPSLKHDLERVERRLNGPAHRPFLDVGCGHLVTLT